MPRPSPFHRRTAELCSSLRWKDWAGFHAVRSYGICHEPEYYALRHSAGVIDVSPLFKYEISGTEAAGFLSWATVRDLSRLAVGRMTYLCWCDDDGKVVDDGTVARLDDRRYRLTAAEPSLAWFAGIADGWEVEIRDVSDHFGTLAVQGPGALDILSTAAGSGIADLRYFGITAGRLGEIEVEISRTGYTGDLGYEIWIPSADCESAWDHLMTAGADFALLPTGLDAMDVTRIEAGFIMNGVDYFSAHHCLVDDRKNSPFELGLNWTIDLGGHPFIGRDALLREKSEGSRRSFVGLVLDWQEVEEVFEGYGLPPEVPSEPWRDGRPLYNDEGRWVGQATSGTWSPLLKQNLALAQIETAFAAPGTTVQIELTAEYRRHRVSATVTPTPFFDPPRKRAR